jgi:predicted dinucleotide-binding enzyme
MKIGFIGVGNIGASIARQLLQAGHTLVVHDIRPEAANALLAAVAAWSRSPAALAAQDRRYLAHQSQHVEPVPLVHAVAPRQLHRPLQLVGDVVEEPWILPAD